MGTHRGIEWKTSKVADGFTGSAVIMKKHNRSEYPHSIFAKSETEADAAKKIIAMIDVVFLSAEIVALKKKIKNLKKGGRA
jgi:hypothetical protein